MQKLNMGRIGQFGSGWLCFEKAVDNVGSVSRRLGSCIGKMACACGRYLEEKAKNEVSKYGNTIARTAAGSARFNG